MLRLGVIYGSIIFIFLSLSLSLSLCLCGVRYVYRGMHITAVGRKQTITSRNTINTPTLVGVRTASAVQHFRFRSTVIFH